MSLNYPIPLSNLKFEEGIMKCQFFFITHIEQLQFHTIKCLGAVKVNVTALQWQDPQYSFLSSNFLLNDLVFHNTIPPTAKNKQNPSTNDITLFNKIKFVQIVQSMIQCDINEYYVLQI